jgi:hypothetical protein
MALPVAVRHDPVPGKTINDTGKRAGVEEMLS